ncbi:vacuolar sorting protein [Anaeramoeba flamelloides]|uniref:Vacuolar protein sorting-associated protein 35 n=1 Tax=Anaeramoeba flamelloides TaxID=1746091 RepID=A0ABQ8YGG5_9EUKA|nr:vacuolar sorting protein [Anaeramoeba flamelloides]
MSRKDKTPKISQKNQEQKKTPTTQVGEQTQLLDSLKAAARRSGFYLQRSVQEGKLSDSIKQAGEMLNGLRSSSLSPKNYYDLYLFVSDELRYFGLLLRESIKKEPIASIIYRDVQFTSRIIPRLYLLITAGAVVIENNPKKTREILLDLLEMCKGVPHPTRGLFLRHYLSQMTKDLLPDISESEKGSKNGNEKEIEKEIEKEPKNQKSNENENKNEKKNENKNVKIKKEESKTENNKNLQGNENEDKKNNVLPWMISINFTIQNLIEMNKLWIRIQHQKLPGNISKLERVSSRIKLTEERKDLCSLVGTNLVRLSQLDSVTLEVYKERVLPILLEQIEQCGDKIAQSYLTEAIILVFPDEYHIHTLPDLFSILPNLHQEVNIKNIIILLIERLINFANNNPKSIENTFLITQIFSKGISSITRKRTSLPRIHLLSILNGLMKLSLCLHPQRIDFINHMLSSCVKSIAIQKKLTKDEINEILSILSTPLDFYNDLNILVQLENYSMLIDTLPNENRRIISLKFLENGLNTLTIVSSPKKVSKLLEITKVLFLDSKDSISENEEDENLKSLFFREQYTVCRFIHLLRSENIAKSFKILQIIADTFSSGGTRRIKITIPPLVFSALQLANGIRQLEKEKKKILNNNNKENKDHDNLEDIGLSAKKIFEFIHKIMTSLTKLLPLKSLKLFLQCALASDKCNFEPIAYEFMTKAILVYNDHLKDPKTQYQMINYISSTLQTLRAFHPDNYSLLCNQCGGYSAKLNIAPHQVRAIVTCSYLFLSIIKQPLNIAYKEIKEKIEIQDEKNKNKKIVKVEKVKKIIEYKRPSNEPVLLYFIDVKRLLGCISRAIRVAGSLMEPSLLFELLIEILNTCLYFFELDSGAVNSSFINTLLDLILQKKSENESNWKQLLTKPIYNFYYLTFKHIKLCKKNKETKRLFKPIKIEKILKDFLK